MNIERKLAIAYALFGVGFSFVIFGFILYITPPKYKEYTEKDIIEKARNLGMEFIKKSIEENSNLNNEEYLGNNKNGKRVVEFVIKKGENSNEIVERLYNDEIINDIEEFSKYLKSKKLSTKIQYGKYILEKSMDYDKLLEKIIVK